MTELDRRDTGTVAEWDNRIQVRLPDDTAAWLASRAERMMSTPHQQARTELDIWRGLLADRLRPMRFTLPQINCIADVMNGEIVDGTLGRIAGFSCADAFEMVDVFGPVSGVSGYGAKWGIDEKALIDALLKLDPLADHALRDAVSRWWHENHEPTVEGWAQVGLTVVDYPPGDGP